jgi:hypothetical protein
MSGLDSTIPALAQTPERLEAAAKADGEALGAVRLDPAAARAADSPPKQFLDGVGRVRQAQVRRDGVAARVECDRRQATGPARKAEACERLGSLRRRLDRLGERRKAAGADKQECRSRLEAVAEELRALPASRRGLISKALLILIEVAVVLFDGFVIHAALEQSGMTPSGVYGTTITVPLAIAACNTAFGLLAGLLALRTPARRWLAAGALAAGLVALLVAFGLLGWFRAEAVDAQNQELAQVASGGRLGSLSFLLSPLWMAPLQLAGSVAAMAVMALWTVGAPGRALRDQVTEHRREYRAAEQAEATVAAELEETERALSEAHLVLHQIEADVQAARVEGPAIVEVVEIGTDGEVALTEAMKSRFETAFLHHDKLYANGDAWRGVQVIRGPWRRASALHTTLSRQPEADPANHNHNGRRRRFSLR